jgi:hypothetical protein
VDRKTIHRISTRRWAERPNMMEDSLLCVIRLKRVITVLSIRILLLIRKSRIIRFWDGFEGIVFLAVFIGFSRREYGNYAIQ